MQADENSDDDNGGLIKADDDGDEDNRGIIMDNDMKYVRVPAHLKTEIAFAHVREHELVEQCYQKRRLDLGSVNAQIDIRVRLIQEACKQLRENRFFLKAIELKDKEENLLIQSFEYDDSHDRNLVTQTETAQE